MSEQRRGRGRKPKLDIKEVDLSDSSDKSDKSNFSITEFINPNKVEIQELNDTSDIPLSDGATIIQEPEIHYPTPEEIQEQERQEHVRLMNEQLAQQRIQTNYEKNVGRSIADQVAQKSVNHTIENALKKGKEQEKLVKTVLQSDLFEADYVNGCIILNGYRTQYQGKIPFNFKKTYETGTTPPNLVKQHLQEVRTILNGQAIPYMLNNILDKGSELVARTSLLLNFPWLNLSQFHENVMAAKNQGFFDDEINQLSVELMGTLGASPSKRLAFKLGMILCNTVLENTPNYIAHKQSQKLHKINPHTAFQMKQDFRDI